MPELTEAKPDRRIKRRKVDNSEVSKRAQAVSVLRDLILQGIFRPNEPITEEAVLRKRPELTKTPVRQALAGLATEGLVIVDSRRTTRVRAVTSVEIRAILGLRYVVETLVVSALARKADVEFREVDALLEEMRRLAAGHGGEPSIGDKCRFAELDIDFHAMLADLADYEPASQFLTNLNTRFRLFAAPSLQTRAIMREVLKEHIRILDAIKGNDETAAREGLSSHLKSAALRWSPYCTSYVQDEILDLMGIKADGPPSPEPAVSPVPNVRRRVAKPGTTEASHA